MVKPAIIRGTEVQPVTPPGAGKESGWMKRIVYPPQAKTNGVFLGISEVNPGYSVHRWHRHTSDKGEGYQVTYPENFEEIYYIVRGDGLIQWKTEEGKIKEVKVGTGDAVVLPVDVVEHQLLNSGPEKMYVVFCGNPTPQVKFTPR